MRIIKLPHRPLIEDGHPVIIRNGVEFVSHRDDGMVAEFLPDDALDLRIGLIVDAGGQSQSASGVTRVRRDFLPAGRLIQDQDGTLA